MDIGRWKIRAMRAEDLDQVASIEEENFSVPWKRRDFAGYLEDQQALFLTASDDAGEVAGYIGCLFAADEGDITNVSVRARHQGTGIGGALVRALLQAAARRGCRRIFLEVRQSNTAARRLYERSGFCESGIRRGYYIKPREDAVLMQASVAAKGR